MGHLLPAAPLRAGTSFPWRRRGSGGLHRRLHPTAGVAAPRSFHNNVGFESPPLAAGFNVALFSFVTLSHVSCSCSSSSQVAFFFFFFSLLECFFPHIPPCCCCCCCLLCCIKSQLRFGMYGGDDGTERWNRFNKSSGLGQALMNGSLAGNAKGITGSFFLGCIDRLQIDFFLFVMSRLVPTATACVLYDNQCCSILYHAVGIGRVGTWDWDHRYATTTRRS